MTLKSWLYLAIAVMLAITFFIPTEKPTGAKEIVLKTTEENTEENTENTEIK